MRAFLMNLLLIFSLVLHLTNSLQNWLTDCFELDGNASPHPSKKCSPSDWADLYQSTDDKFIFSGILNDYSNGAINSSNDLTLFDSSKDIQFIKDWKWKSDLNPAKMLNIENSFAYAKEIDGSGIIYVGATLFGSINDTSTVAFWLLQDSIELINSTNSFSGEHNVNDLLIQITVETNKLVINLYRWIEDSISPQIGGSISNIEIIENSNSDKTCNNSLASITTVCGNVNKQQESSPWDYNSFEVDINDDTFPVKSFIEAGLNVTHYLNFIPCYESFITETRQSSDVTTLLSDFIIGELAFCNLQTNVQCLNNSNNNYVYSYTIYKLGIGSYFNVSLLDNLTQEVRNIEILSGNSNDSFTFNLSSNDNSIIPRGILSLCLSPDCSNSKIIDIISDNECTNDITGMNIPRSLHRELLSDATDPPTRSPTLTPTSAPTEGPTAAPTRTPTTSPTSAPTPSPTPAPTLTPTSAPTHSPSAVPTSSPTSSPTFAPTPSPTDDPTLEPSLPTNEPTTSPTIVVVLPPDPPPCPLLSVLDIGFVLDASGTLGASEFALIRNFTAKIVRNHLPANTNEFLYTFGFVPSLIYGLNESTDFTQEELSQLTEGVNYEGALTALKGALYQAWLHFKNESRSSAISRKLFIFSDGQGNIGAPLPPSVPNTDHCVMQPLFDAFNIEVYFIGVGTDYDFGDAACLTTSDRIFNISDVTPLELSLLLQNITNITCDGGTFSPTTAPTSAPTFPPTAAPSRAPSFLPTAVPTTSPTSAPTPSPTPAPTQPPTGAPTTGPTGAPTATPTSSPTSSPTPSPTDSPSYIYLFIFVCTFHRLFCH